MRGHRQEGPSNHACPKRVRSRQVHREVEEMKFTGRIRNAMDLRPSSRHVLAEGQDGNDGAADVDRHLDDVGPDHCRHAALKRIEQRQRGDDRDREHVPRPNRDSNHDRDDKDANSLGCGTRQQKQARRHFVEGMAEAVVDQLIGRHHLALEVLRKEDRRHNDAPDHVSEDHLQEAEVPREGDARDRDDGERAGLRRNDGEAYRPPGDRVARKKVVLQRTVFTSAKAQAKNRNADQIERNDRQIQIRKPRSERRSN